MKRRTCVWLAILVAAAGSVGSGQEGAIRFKLTVVTPTDVLTSALVTIKDRQISSVTPGADSPSAIAIDGVMFPGLIDLHNHLTWNVIPDWRPPRVFANRYEWQETPEYALNLSGPHAALMASGAGCDMNRFGEVKSIVNGGTVTVGSLGPTDADAGRNRCIEGLARNVDFAADLHSPPTLNREPFRNYVFPFELGEDDERTLRAIDPNSRDPSHIRAAVLHVAEGTDSASRREFQLLKAHRYLRRGVSVIHGVALTPDQIRELARAGVGLVWSPHSNFSLYGKTADVLSALDAGMTVAVAPDWGPTGSAGMIEELGVAYRYNAGTLGGAIPDQTLVKMATINAARLSMLDGQLGSIEPGKLADLVIMKRRGPSAYHALLLANPGDVLLVTVGGVPIYGDRILMERLVPRARLEPIDVCGEPKALHIVEDPASDQSWSHVRERLTGLMKQIGLAPSPLARCGAANQ